MSALCRHPPFPNAMILYQQNWPGSGATVLEQMAELEMISEAERQEPSPPLSWPAGDGQAPYFLDYVKNSWRNDMEPIWFTGRLRVHTTLNPHYQRLLKKPLPNRSSKGHCCHRPNRFIGQWWAAVITSSHSSTGLSKPTASQFSLRPCLPTALETGWQQNAW